MIAYNCNNYQFLIVITKVTRINTYTTVPAAWTDDQLKLAKSVDIVTFASPSTVRIWAERTGAHGRAVVIGPTSKVAAEKAGFTSIYSPSAGSKGIEPWAKLVEQVADELLSVRIKEKNLL